MKNIWKSLLQKWASLAGYELSPLPPQSERLDVHLKTLFERLNINCVFDVGANRGQYGRFLRELGFEGRIISFEPVTTDFEILADQASIDSDWQAHQIALGERESERFINVTSDSLFNSFLNPNEFIKNQGLRVTQQEKVKIQPLDKLFHNFLEGLNQPQPYLKLDTQGFDFEVLDGTIGVLDRIVALQIELSVKPVYEKTPYYLDSIVKLEELGFEVTGFFPIARDNALRVVEFDCVMVKSTTAGETTGIYPP